jgi:hypothetical protein
VSTEIREIRTPAAHGGKIIFRKWPNGKVYVSAGSESSDSTYALVSLKGLREIAEVATQLAGELALAEAAAAERAHA